MFVFIPAQCAYTYPQFILKVIIAYMVYLGVGHFRKK